MHHMIHIFRRKIVTAITLYFKQIEEYVHQTQMLLGEMSEIEKSQFLTQQRQFQKLTADIDEMEKEIESTRIQSHQE